MASSTAKGLVEFAPLLTHHRAMRLHCASTTTCHFDATEHRRLLTGMSTDTLEDAFSAVDALHDGGPSTVVVTSSNLPAGQSDHMLMLVSCPWGESFVVVHYACVNSSHHSVKASRKP